MDEYFDSNKIFKKINKDARKWQIIIICLTVGIMMLSMILFILLNYYHAGGSELFWKVPLIYSGIIIQLIMFLIAPTKIGQYFKLIELILFQFKKDVTFTMSYFFRATIRTLLSLSIFMIVSFLPAIILIINDQFNSIDYAQYSGTFLITVFIVFLCCYGVILLPHILALKIGKKENVYIYWFYFLKGRLSDSGYSLLIGVPLLLLTSILIILTTWAYQLKPVLEKIDPGKKEISITNKQTTKFGHNMVYEVFKDNNRKNLLYEKEYIKSSNFLEVDRFGLLLSSFGIWLSIIMIFIGDILKNYQQLYTVFEEYTSHILRERILVGNKIRFILIGYGRMNKRTMIHIIKTILRYEDTEKKPLSNFEMVIDREYNLRIVPREVAVIDNNKNVFEETRFDQNCGIEYGFVNSGGLVLFEERKNPNEAALATFGILGDGKSLASLKLAGMDHSEIIIQASSEADMGINLHRLLKNYPFAEKPILITTVEDSSNYSYLEQSNELPIFPLHPGITEGNGLGSRLFMLIMKLTNNTLSLGNCPFIIISGTGKTTYYVLKQFVILAWVLGQSKEYLKIFLKNRLTVLTMDKHIRENHSKENESNDIWQCDFGHDLNFEIPVILRSPENLNLFFEKYNNDNLQDNGIVFAVISENFYEELNVLQHIKQYAGEQNGIKKLAIISSVENDLLHRYESVIMPFKKVMKELLEEKGFPHKTEDLVIKRDLLTGSQITSLMDCLYTKQPNTGIRRNFPSAKTTEQGKQSKNAGVIAICAENSPGVLVSTLTMISGMKGLKPVAGAKYIPSFYYSYSFKVSEYDQKWPQTFIFRGDCFLSKMGNEYNGNSHICGININGTDSFMKEYCEVFKRKLMNIKMDTSCGYHPTCPVSAHHYLTKELDSEAKGSKNGTNKTKPDKYSDILATVKIWADQDDTPGALAMAIADFLLLGADSTTNGIENMSSVMNIVYESCNLCSSSNKLIMRFYAKSSSLNDENIIKNREKLMDRSNIIGLKIKLNQNADEKWKAYFELLKDYMNSVSDSQYDPIKLDDEFQLFKQSRRDTPGSRAFFDRL